MNEVVTKAWSSASKDDEEVALTPKLELCNVSQTFPTRKGRVTALEDCSLTIQAREFVTIVGPSGCGKSTLMSIAAGLDKPTHGSVLVNGKPAGPPGPERSVVFQAFALFPSMTVVQNIEFGLKIAKIDKAERRARVAEQLSLMGLEQFGSAFPHELSGGMKQRVAIARALVVRPDILLMDEPFGALDAQTRALLQEEVSRLRRDMNYTVVFITHSVEEAVYLADRVVVMTKRPGRIKKSIDIPASSAWRAHNIEEAMGFQEFSDLRQEVWHLVREEISGV